jgi:hypothetical protein
MAELVLGPVHRYVGETDATVWPVRGRGPGAARADVLRRGTPLWRSVLPRRPAARAAVHVEPDEDERGREWDALYALALRMRSQPAARWPDRLLMLTVSQ